MHLGGFLAAADAAAQLVQLRQSEAVGVLNDHDRGVGHVHAHLDNRRGHEHLRLVVAEALHDGLLLGSGHAPVQKLDPIIGEQDVYKRQALYLTATPIPRSLALALFGNLTLSYLKHRPHDAAQRATFVHQKADRGHAYDAARAALARGEQVYVVCPLIGQDSGERDAKAADGGSGGRRREADEEAYEYAAISIETCLLYTSRCV